MRYLTSNAQCVTIQGVEGNKGGNITEYEMRNYKAELIKNYGCVDCSATDEAAAKYQKVENDFRDALEKRRREIEADPLTSKK